MTSPVSDDVHLPSGNAIAVYCAVRDGDEHGWSIAEASGAPLGSVYALLTHLEAQGTLEGRCETAVDLPFLPTQPGACTKGGGCRPAPMVNL
ncbi:hypothetical protein [Deinococcus hopiensis]|uniref:Uncharacterized protein n=1 Tax=Deinococcus hopiensis KR-140 TaxID=695939 RepID=A0A1W1UQP3_9DEIO|nr:hypothetical protein [Deinococcus hopiensis]SMB83376.1 hypothetical protein SAMN00790413_04395 [Deinococcus hopiensis KR-140]